MTEKSPITDKPYTTADLDSMDESLALLNTLFHTAIIPIRGKNYHIKYTASSWEWLRSFGLMKSKAEFANMIKTKGASVNLMLKFIWCGLPARVKEELDVYELIDETSPRDFLGIMESFQVGLKEFETSMTDEQRAQYNGEVKSIQEAAEDFEKKNPA